MNNVSGIRPENSTLDAEIAADIAFLNAKIQDYNQKSAASGGRIFTPTAETLKKMAERCRNATITSDVAFKSVMLDNRECTKLLLETVLGFKIVSLEYIETEVTNQTGLTGPQTRFDVVVTDTEGRAYDIEMQAHRHGNAKRLWRRARKYFSVLEYRQSHIMSAGGQKQERAGTYVLFLCNFDPVGGRKRVYRYPWQGPHQECEEPWAFEDHIVFVNSCGTIGDDAPGLIEFCEYMREGKVNGELTRLADATLQNLKQQEWKTFMTDFMLDELRKFDLNEAESVGIDKGIDIGIDKGIDIGADGMAKLVDILLAKNDLSTLRRLSSMTGEERKALFREYGIKV